MHVYVHHIEQNMHRSVMQMLIFVVLIDQNHTYPLKMQIETLRETLEDPNTKPNTNKMKVGFHTDSLDNTLCIGLQSWDHVSDTVSSVQGQNIISTYDCIGADWG